MTGEFKMIQITSQYSKPLKVKTFTDGLNGNSNYEGNLGLDTVVSRFTEKVDVVDIKFAVSDSIVSYSVIYRNKDDFQPQMAQGIPNAPLGDGRINLLLKKFVEKETPKDDGSLYYALTKEPLVLPSESFFAQV